MLQDLPRDLLSEIVGFLGSRERLRAQIETQLINLCFESIRMSRDPRMRKQRWMARGMVYLIVQVSRTLDDPSDLLIETILITKRLLN